MEVNEASSIIQEAAHEDANIIFGAVVDPSLAGRTKITVIATGFESQGNGRRATQTPTDLANYTVNAAREPVAAAGAAVAAPRSCFRRRPSIDLSAARAADPATNGNGAHESEAPSALTSRRL